MSSPSMTLAAASWLATPASFASHLTGGEWERKPHLERLSNALMEAATLGGKRLIVNMPPRHGKSELTSKWFPVWYLSQFPKRRVILCSYADEFASTWGRQARRLAVDHGAKIGLRLDPDAQASHDWRTAQGGGMLTAGFGGGVTGHGCDVLLVDDYCKNPEDAFSDAVREDLWHWWQSTALTRLEPGASVVVVATRWHQDDLVGRILANEPGRWEQLTFPALAEADDPLGRAPGDALWPERRPREELERTRDTSEVWVWNGLYQQRPAKLGGLEWGEGTFGEDRWVANIPPDAFTENGRRVMALDPSLGKSTKHGDFSAIASLAVHEGLVYVEGDLERRGTGVLVDAMIDQALRFKPHGIFVETNTYQELLERLIIDRATERKLPPLPMYGAPNTVNKELRIRRLEPWLRSGRVRWVERPGTRLLVRQLQEFPGKHDDGPDALEMAQRLMQVLFPPGDG